MNLEYEDAGTSQQLNQLAQRVEAEAGPPEEWAGPALPPPPGLLDAPCPCALPASTGGHSDPRVVERYTRGDTGGGSGGDRPGPCGAGGLPAAAAAAAALPPSSLARLSSSSSSCHSERETARTAGQSDFRF